MTTMHDVTMPAGTIAAAGCSGAIFHSLAALYEHAGARLAYDRAARRFAKNDDFDALTARLASLGYSPLEIAAHVGRPAYRVPRDYHATDRFLRSATWAEIEDRLSTPPVAWPVAA